MKSKLSASLMIFLIAISTVLGFSSHSFAAPTQWIVEDGGNGHFYEAILVPEGITWTDANNAAQAMGGGWHLATITSAGENAFVESLFSSQSDFFNCCLYPTPLGRIASGPWLGGSSSTNASNDWTWVTGESFVYTDWGWTAPASNGNHISFAEFGTSRDVAWNDLPDSHSLIPYGYIVETTVVPEPISSTLFIVGGATLGFRRFRKKFKK